MRGYISLIAVAVLTAFAAQTSKPTLAQALAAWTKCSAPAISDLHWTWVPDSYGYKNARDLDLHFTLDPRGSVGGTLYLEWERGGGLGGDVVATAGPINSSTSEINSNTSGPFYLGKRYHFQLSYWNGCVGDTARYGLLADIWATSGKSGQIGPAPKPVSCPSYYVIDTRGSGQSQKTLSVPGAAFVAALKLIKGKNAVQAVANPYEAVGIVPTLQQLKASLGLGWSGLIAKLKALGMTLNGLGAAIHSAQIGAYNDSVKNGGTKLRGLIKAEIAACEAKGTKLLLTGYSQGAQVTANVYQRIPSSERRHIFGVVLFGDPKYYHLALHADVYRRDNDGIASSRGLFPNDSKGKVLSFCHARDPICQGWGQLLLHGFGAHRTYTQFDEPKIAAKYFG